MNRSRKFLSHFRCIIDPRKNAHNERHELSDTVLDVKRFLARLP